LNFRKHQKQKKTERKNGKMDVKSKREEEKRRKEGGREEEDG
jgi:hypothetical protein